MTVSVMGLISLSLLSLQRIGVAGMLQTSLPDLAMMLLAGVCNAIAFVSLTRCLQLTSVVYTNALNAAQAALAAIAGVLIFREPFDRDRATAVAFPYDAGALEIFEEYARLRQAFDRKQWSTLQKVGLDRLSVLRRVYVDAHWERLYGQWEQRGPAVVTAASAPPTHPSSTGVFDGYVVPHSYAATQAVRGPR